MQAPDPSQNDLSKQDPTQKLGKSFAWITWLLVLGLVYLFFADAIEQKLNPNQQLATGRDASGHAMVTLTRNAKGHYVGVLQLNGQPVEFLLDTGATQVAVSESVAARTGMPKGRAHQVATANGITTAYQSEIAELRLGDIVFYQLPASIVPNLPGSEILLGMSALKHLEFAQQANQLQLVQKNP
jgi:aspartyl protease family protein